jgi:purine-binding chemotaxis protein CheW
MVDLVKIRRKAKEKKDAEAAAAQETAPEVTAVPSEEASRVEEEAAPAPEPEPAPKRDEAVAVTPVEEAQAAAAPAEISEKLAKFKRTAGQRQGFEGIAVTSEEGTDSEAMELLLFSIAGEQYALTIESIVEITRPRSATRVPNSPESVVGIISLRGTVVTILDIRRKLGHPPLFTPTDDTRIIVVEFRGETSGFLVDRVSRVIRMDPSRIETHPVVSSAEQSEFIRGVFQHGQKLSIFLDLDRLLDF